MVVYDQCRQTQMFSVETAKGSGKQQVRVIKVVELPTGYHHFPEDGGLFDQPYRLMEFLDIFYNVERSEAYRKLNS